MTGTFDMAAMVREITADEGTRLTVYDDATGLPVRPGTVMQGHPTIGVGRALDVHGITQAEAAYLLGNDLRTGLSALSVHPWFAALDGVRQRALVNMAFQMGVPGLLKFGGMIGALAVHDYEGAARMGGESLWATEQAPARAARVLAMIRTGEAET